MYILRNDGLNSIECCRTRIGLHTSAEVAKESHQTLFDRSQNASDRIAHNLIHSNRRRLLSQFSMCVKWPLWHGLVGQWIRRVFSVVRCSAHNCWRSITKTLRKLASEDVDSAWSRRHVGICGCHRESFMNYWPLGEFGYLWAQQGSFVKCHWPTEVKKRSESSWGSTCSI